MKLKKNNNTLNKMKNKQRIKKYFWICSLNCVVALEYIHFEQYKWWLLKFVGGFVLV
jgi:hypothetical protein